MNSDISYKLDIFNNLITYALNATNIVLKDDILFDNNSAMSWSDRKKLLFNNKIFNTNIIGLFVYGNLMIEFIESDQIVNWIDYPIDIIKQVNDYLKINFN